MLLKCWQLIFVRNKIFLFLFSKIFWHFIADFILNTDVFFFNYAQDVDHDNVSKNHGTPKTELFFVSMLTMITHSLYVRYFNSYFLV